MDTVYFQGLLDVQLEDFYEASSGRDLRRHDFQLRHRRSDRARRGAAFSVRLSRSWNAHPLGGVTTPTRVAFKRLLGDRGASPLPRRSIDHTRTLIPSGRHRPLNPNPLWYV